MGNECVVFTQAGASSQPAGRDASEYNEMTKDAEPEKLEDGDEIAAFASSSVNETGVHVGADYDHASVDVANAGPADVLYFLSAFRTAVVLFTGLLVCVPYTLYSVSGK